MAGAESACPVIWGSAPGGATHSKEGGNVRWTYSLRFDVLCPRYPVARSRGRAGSTAGECRGGDRGGGSRLERRQEAPRDRPRLGSDQGSDLPDVLRYKNLQGYYATVRQDTDDEFGVVGERYRTVQNHEAFAFVDQLLGSAIHFETAGSLHGGRRVWVLATLPEHVEVGGDAVRP